MRALFRKLPFFFLLLQVSIAIAVGSPVDMLKTTANQTIQALKQNRATLKTNPRVVYSIINRLLLPHVDVYAMSRSALGPRVWNSATPAERQQFSQEFVRVVVRTYASALANYSDEQVEFLPLRMDDQSASQVQVDSNILRPDGPPIRLSYSVVRRGGGWKVYDMSVEGVSLLQSFRADFAEQLANGSLSALIQQLRAKNNNSAEE